MLQFGKYKMDTNEIINQLREENEQLKQLNTAALNVVFRIKDAAIALGCEANDGMAMLDYLIETARASVMVNQKNIELQAQLVAVQDSVVHGKCANSEPCATFCEAIATRKMFKNMQDDRNAYQKLADSMAALIVKHRRIFTDKELKGAEQHLVAHDAEVKESLIPLFLLDLSESLNKTPNCVRALNWNDEERLQNWIKSLTAKAAM